MTAKRTPKTSRTKAKHQVWHSLLRFGLKTTLVLLLTLFVYLIYLDSKITTLFSGNKWQVPAQLYARALELSAGTHLSPQNLLEELARLQYREDPRLNGPGQYWTEGRRISVVRRPFVFADGAVAAQRLDIDFGGDFIEKVSSNGKAINRARLEPQLLQHLVSPEQEDREIVSLKQTPQPIIQSLMAVEDRDFYQHHGISPLAVLRALWNNVLAGHTVQGGSTLTQQLAKNMYTDAERNLLRKVNEALIALVLDYRYSKDEILEAYLNEIFIGQFKDNPVHGLGLGSKLYFGKPLAELRPHEYALLIGLIKGPSYYDPRRFPERALSRRDLVLDMIAEQGILNHDQHNMAKAQPLDVIPLGAHLQGRFPAYLDQVKTELRQQVPDAAVWQQGIRIFTYFDPAAQQALEQATSKRLETLKPDIEVAAVATDYQTGRIKAMIGGRQFQFAGYNRAISARRQIGSIIKPVVYLTALAQPQNFTLGTVLQDTPLTLRSGGQSWSPQNYDKKLRGSVPLIEALAQSLNIPTVRLGMQLGLNSVKDTLQKLGLERDVTMRPSSLLGAVELSPLEVSQLYQTIANKGQHVPLASLAAVTSAKGTLIYQRKMQASQRVRADATYLLQYAMQQATQTGTAAALSQQFPGVRFAGKTGTSSDYRDSWFSGFDHETSLVVWLGRDDNQPIQLTGGAGALPLFSEYFRLQAPNSLFRAVPPSVNKVLISRMSGRPVKETCVNVLLLPAISVEMPLQDSCQ
ncbi:MAG TPA: penicillin-binding protein 1B [Rheinheimera sp.]|nr:penicillin-binding protein 1B [Rheinheimera sp.]